MTSNTCFLSGLRPIEEREKKMEEKRKQKQAAASKVKGGKGRGGGGDLMSDLANRLGIKRKPK